MGLGVGPPVPAIPPLEVGVGVGGMEEVVGVIQGGGMGVEGVEGAPTLMHPLLTTLGEFTSPLGWLGLRGVGV